MNLSRAYKFARGTGSFRVKPEALDGTPPAEIAASLNEFKNSLKSAKSYNVDIRRRKILETIVNAENAFKGSGESIGQVVNDLNLQIEDILNIKGNAFLDPQLQRKFREWKQKPKMKNIWQSEITSVYKELTEWLESNPGSPSLPPLPLFLQPGWTPRNVKEEIFLQTHVQVKELDKYIEELEKWIRTTGAYPTMPLPTRAPLDWVKGMTNSSNNKTCSRLKLFLGENFRENLPITISRKQRALQKSPHWPSLVDCVWEELSPGVIGRNLLQQILKAENNAEFTAAVQRVLGVGTLNLSLYWDYSNPAHLTEARELIRNLVAKVSDKATLPADALSTLMGKYDMSPEEFIHRVLIAHDVLRQECLIRYAGDIPIAEFPIDEEIFQQLLEFPGVHKWILESAHGGGFENGNRFEIFLTARALAEGKDKSNLFLQVAIDKKKGPDMVIVKGDSARIIQAKSYRDLNALLTTTPSRSAEIFRQLEDDLIRLKKENKNADVLEITIGEGTKKKLDQTIEFLIDWRFLAKDHMQGFDRLLRDKGLKIEDMDSLDPEISKQVREVFHKNYIEPKVGAINTKLQQEGAIRTDGKPFKLEVKLVDHFVDPAEKIFEM